jgi:hypothetical protein
MNVTQRPCLRYRLLVLACELVAPCAINHDHHFHRYVACGHDRLAHHVIRADLSANPASSAVRPTNLKALLASAAWSREEPLEHTTHLSDHTMNSLKVARAALRVSAMRSTPALKRGYADVAPDKIRLSLALPHQVRLAKQDRRGSCKGNEMRASSIDADGEVKYDRQSTSLRMCT